MPPNGPFFAVSESTTVPGRLSQSGLFVIISALVATTVALRIAGRCNKGWWRAVRWMVAGGAYPVYLDAWERHVTAVEDSCLEETALGGPDTTPR
jgi:hypothetical protein